MRGLGVGDVLANPVQAIDNFTHLSSRSLSVQRLRRAVQSTNQQQERLPNQTGWR